MTNWMPTKAGLGRPFHIGVADAIGNAIKSGALMPGDRLPTQRALAFDLGLSVHTVGKAYDELRRRGLVSGEVGRGTFVRGVGNVPSQPFLLERGEETIDLSISRPVGGAIHTEKMHLALGELAQGIDQAIYLATRPNVGLPRHRAAAVPWLAALGLHVDPAQVILINGVCHGLPLALATVARPGDLIVTEGVAHHLIVLAANVLGFRLKGLPIDDDGILPDAFEAACREQGVKVLFTVPTLANPTVHVLSVERRQAIAKIAERYDIAIIEDDAWGPLMVNRPPPVSAFAPAHSIYLTSFTKCVMPGLRAGYLVAPERLIPVVTSRLVVLGWMATPLIFEAASRWLDDGTARELVEWQRLALAERKKIVDEEMQGFDYRAAADSLHFWLTLPEPWTVGQVVERCRFRGIAIAPSSPFITEPSFDNNAVRVAIGAPVNVEQLRKGLRGLRDLISKDPEPLPLAG